MFENFLDFFLIEQIRILFYFLGILYLPYMKCYNNLLINLVAEVVYTVVMCKMFSLQSFRLKYLAIEINRPFRSSSSHDLAISRNFCSYRSVSSSYWSVSSTTVNFSLREKLISKRTRVLDYFMSLIHTIDNTQHISDNDVPETDSFLL